LALPINCLLVQGVYVGSCTYNDLCKDVLQGIAEFDETNCPAELADWGIDCNCPFNVPAQTVDGSITGDIPDLATTVISFMANGDFDIRATINNASNQHVACFRFLLTVQKA
jgi:hypothetical protein